MPKYQIETSQTGPHCDLDTVVTKHLHSCYRKPIPDHQYQLFKQAQDWVNESKRSVILDMGCGVARSSVLLAKMYPEHAVIGVDKSRARLQRNPYYRDCPLDKRDCPLDNLLLLPGNSIDFWRLAAQQQLPVVKQYILYPNPYPKANDLTKRWHGHPVLPWLLNTCSNIEVRSNWSVYLQEFGRACQLIQPELQLQWLSLKDHTEPLTHFERQYQQVGESIHGLLITD